MIEIRAEIVGVVCMFHADAGARVKKGETVLEIECMKTLFPFQAPADGVFKPQRELGETVGEGDVVAIIEED